MHPPVRDQPQPEVLPAIATTSDNAFASVAPHILLCTLNARYTHAALGLRYLKANMGHLQAHTHLLELTINRPRQALLQAVLNALPPAKPATSGKAAPIIVGFGVYIWNTEATLALIADLRAHRPDLTLVLGGPEVSHETDQQAIVAAADFVITGWGDISFAKLCQALIKGPRPLMKIIPGEQPPLDAIALPYGLYTDEDIAHRTLYVEASRGCPFKCEFCLSSLDKTAWAFDQELFLEQIRKLYARGARQFKFVDRTFNLKIDASARILQFFLDRLQEDPSAPLFVHFELIPDQLPERLKTLIAQFPPGVLQFEIGIQTFNPEVQQRISRRQDDAKTVAALTWLVQHSHAHLHTDLIFGLPGESLASFAQGFDKLYALQPHEIQLGLLKRLRGTPIARHTQAHGMVYDPLPPYTVQQTAALSATEVQQFTRMARYWDVLANSGRYQQAMALVMASSVDSTVAPSLPASSTPSPFWRFWHLSQALFNATQTTFALTPEVLVDCLFDYLTQTLHLPTEAVRAALLADYLASGAKAKPACLADLLTRRQRKGHSLGLGAPVNPLPKSVPEPHVNGKRQRQHLRGEALPQVLPQTLP